MKQPKINLDNYIFTLNRRGKSLIKCKTCLEHELFEAGDNYDQAIENFVRPFTSKHNLQHGIYVSEKNVQKQMQL